MLNKVIPGTQNYYSSDDGFVNYKKMIELADGISLSQLCNITNLEPYVIQNWVKRGYVPHPINKKYYTNHLARTLLINALRECMYIEDIGSLLSYINGDVDDEKDDLISEEELFKTFSSIIYKLDDVNDVDLIINKEIKNAKLNKCIKAMVYAYISSVWAKKSKECLKNIEKKNEK